MNLRNPFKPPDGAKSTGKPKDDPYCGFKDDCKRHQALKVAQVCETIRHGIRGGVLIAALLRPDLFEKAATALRHLF
jgi:hypothetical protein